jgi:hypothetical protein
MNVNPLFIHLMDRYMALDAAGLGDTDEACQLFVEAMDYAPESFKRDLRSKAIELGLMPEKPDGYSDDGQPLYHLEAMANRLGIDPEEIPETIKQFGYTGTVHSVQ